MVSAKMNVLQIVVDHSHINRVLRTVIATRRFRVDPGTLAAMGIVLVSHKGLSLKVLLFGRSRSF